MQDLQLDRVDGAGDNQKALQGTEAALSRAVWDSISQAFSLSKKNERPPIGHLEAARPEKDSSSNQWQTRKRLSEGTELLTFNASIKVDKNEFLRTNPELKDKISENLGISGMKVRHATTGQVDAGWKLNAINDDGTLSLSKSYDLTVNHGHKPNGLVETLSGVPESHRSELEKKLSELPENVLSALKDNGYKIIGARLNTQAIPELGGLTPRGWPSSSTFDHSDGTHDNVRRLIIAPLMYKNEKNELVPTERPEVVVHQIGHALDHALGKLSNNPDFQNAFRQDMQDLRKKGWLMSERERLIYDYFNQKDGPGKDERPGSEECFASLFGLALTGPENPEDKPVLENNFKRSLEVVRQIIRKL